MMPHRGTTRHIGQGSVPYRRLSRKLRRRIYQQVALRWGGTKPGLRRAIGRFLRPLRKRLDLLRRAAREWRLATLLAAAFLAGGAMPAAAGVTTPDGPIELSDVAAGMGGFVINGIDADDGSGYSVSGAGDVNGDGLADLIVGASGADPGGDSAAGESYVVFGKTDGAAVELSDVAAGMGGFVINGIDPGDDSGISVSNAGDVNGDGLADLIVGAFSATPDGRSFAGVSYVVFGKSDGAAVELSDVAAGTGGFAINGVADYDYSGISVSGAGDVNGDGLADLIVGASEADPRGDSYAGESYVVFGKADGAPVELSTIALGFGGFAINGIDDDDASGFSVSGAGDVNGDGLADLIVGAPGNDRGESYVVFGKADAAPVELSTISLGFGGFLIKGDKKRDESGFSVSGAGDVNGDGLADLIVGAPGTKPGSRDDAGVSYVVFGKLDGAEVQLSDVADGFSGFAINGIDPDDRSGVSVSGVGDVNNDGMADLIVGADAAEPGGSAFVGESYLIFGKADGAPVTLASIALGFGGFVINGIDTDDRSGRSVSGAGDVNGDGVNDLIVGAPGADPGGDVDAGESYVLFSPLPPLQVGFCETASSLDETDGNDSICVRLSVESTDVVQIGFRVSGGTATPDIDFVLTEGTLTFTPGVVSQSIPIGLLVDTMVEGNETVLIELFSPVGATIDPVRREHVLTIVDAVAETTGLRIDRWVSRPNSVTPANGRVIVAGEINDQMMQVELNSGGDLLFAYDGGTVTDALAPSGFVQRRGAKFRYSDATRRGSFLHRIGGSSRTKFSFNSKQDVSPVAALPLLRVAMTSDGFSDEVSLVPVPTAKGSSFKIARDAYAEPELYVDSLLVKRFPPTQPDRDFVRLTARFPGAPNFLPESDTLVVDLGFFRVLVPPNTWTRNRAGTAFTHTRTTGVSKITIKVSLRRRTISVTARKLTLTGPVAATPQASIAVGFGDFAKVNGLILQAKVTGSGAEIFRY